MIGQLIDAGVNLIDTADSYGDGEAEMVLGRALAGHRDKIVLCTKGTNRTGPGANDVGQSRIHLMRALDASLRRLATDRVDVYYMHGFDRMTRIDDQLRTLDDMVRLGKVRYIGCSNFAAWQIMKALGVSDKRGLEPYVCTQAYHSLVEREVVPVVMDQDLALIVWGALGGGFLTGKFTRADWPDDSSRRLRFDFPPIDPERGYAIVDVAADIAQRHEATVAQVALAWQIARPFVTSTLFGARDEAQIKANLKAADLCLDAADLQALDDISRLPSEYPQWLFDRPMARVPDEQRDWATILKRDGETKP